MSQPLKEPLILPSTIQYCLMGFFLSSSSHIGESLYLIPVNSPLFRQKTYLRNKKHMLTCQGGTGCYRAVNYQPGS